MRVRLIGNRAVVHFQKQAVGKQKKDLHKKDGNHGHSYEGIGSCIVGDGACFYVDLLTFSADNLKKHFFVREVSTS